MRSCLGLILSIGIGLSYGAQASAGVNDYSWLRLFGMWHDQLTPSGWALGAGAKLDPSDRVTLAIDGEIRLQRENLNANAQTVGNAMGLVVPVTLQYTFLGNHYSPFQPFVALGGYYTSSERGGNEIGGLLVGGMAVRLGTEVLALDFRYYTDTYVTDLSDPHHYAARLSLWFQPAPAKAVRSTGSSSRPSTNTSTNSGNSGGTKPQKRRY